jgi:hypothetical protein
MAARHTSPGCCGGSLRYGDGHTATQPSAHVLAAEVALAQDELDHARGLAAAALSCPASPEVSCHALEVLGRVERLSDLGAARAHFEQALSVAREHDLPLWQVRAMHELGTIDMFDHAGTERLEQARQAAGEFGALSTAADVDLQLAAVGHSRFELDMAGEHARSALAVSGKLSLAQVRAKALTMLAENAAWRGDGDEMERFIALGAATAPEDRMLGAFAWGARGMRELLHGDRVIAVEHLGRATVSLADLPHAEPACFRAVWPVLLASMEDRRAAAAVREARRLGVGGFHLNSGLLVFAEAIMAGRSTDPGLARRLAVSTQPDFVNCQVWAGVARWLAAESAASHRWDQPDWWLAGVAGRLYEHGLVRLASRCEALSGGPQRWAGLAITDRESDVLSLVERAHIGGADIGLKPRASANASDYVSENRARLQIVARTSDAVSAVIAPAVFRPNTSSR